jgi:hypothetical protein
MATKKITLTELRQLVKNIIKEENEYSDLIMSDMLFAYVNEFMVDFHENEDELDEPYSVKFTNNEGGVKINSIEKGYQELSKEEIERVKKSFSNKIKSNEIPFPDFFYYKISGGEIKGIEPSDY